jgi:hypothetical protein
MDVLAWRKKNRALRRAADRRRKQEAPDGE